MNLFFVSLGNGELLIFFYDSLRELCDTEAPILNTAENNLSFIPNLTHEVRSPMNIILGFSSLLKSEELELDEIKVYAALIQQNAYVLLQLIQNIGTFSRINQNEFSVNREFLLVTNFVDEVFKNVSDVITSKSNSNNFKVECSGDEVERMVVNADREVMEQIFINFTRYILSLVKNQSVLFSCEPFEKSKVRFFLRFGLDEAHYQLLEKQLDPNYKFDTSNIQSGNDLSLFIAVMLLRLINLKIELKRLPNGQVNLFFLFQNYFNEDPVAQYKTNEKAILNKPFIWENKKILVADDNKYSIQFFETIFRKTKAEIISVRNGREAYEYCRKNKDVDLIIMDWLMPIMDGETSTKFIKQLYPSIPIIAVTAFALSDERDRIMRSGCSAYYPKPVDRLELMNYINSLFE
jgi:CheY-like chemotaxis protein